jgi:hypothetical protein
VHTSIVPNVFWRLVVGLFLGVTATCSSDGQTRTTTTTAVVTLTTVAPTTLVTTAATSTSAAGTNTTVASTSPALDTTSAVLAAAVLYRATVGNSWDDPDRFNTLHIVERLGEPHDDGFITGVDAGRPLTDSERSAIEAALAPRTVRWVPSRESVIGDQPSSTILERDAVITIAEPEIDGPRAEVGTELWCGFTCGLGTISVLELSPAGEWTVTEQIGGYTA